jgi:hypothetical protein
MASLVDRLVVLTEQVMEGDHAALRRIVEAAGGTWITDTDGSNPRCSCVHGMMVGIPVGCDPVGTYVQVCFAVFGQCWPAIPECFDGMRALNERWSARTKQARRAKAIAR